MNPPLMTERMREEIINRFSYLSQAPSLRKYAPWQDGRTFKNPDPGNTAVFRILPSTNKENSEKNLNSTLLGLK
jgi:hypothetical protein